MGLESFLNYNKNYTIESCTIGYLTWSIGRERLVGAEGGLNTWNTALETLCESTTELVNRGFYFFLIGVSRHRFLIGSEFFTCRFFCFKYRLKVCLNTVIQTILKVL